jgi:uncharacterized Rossmann fold enzyme
MHTASMPYDYNIQHTTPTSMKVTESKADLKQMQSQYSSAKFKAEALALKSGGSGGKSQNSNQKLDNSTATLEQSRNILHQTEQIGDDVITDLEGQKETLTETKEKVRVF